MGLIERTEVFHMVTAQFNRLVASILIIAVAAFFFISPASGVDGSLNPTQKAIQHLLDYVIRSDRIFIRNSKQYSAQEASEHMQKKYEHFRDEIETPEKFIELCATRSLLSGKPYLVIDRQGKTIKTSEWLETELEAYRNHNAGRSH